MIKYIYINAGDLRKHAMTGMVNQIMCRYVIKS